MTVEELREEARKLGYKIVKLPSRKLPPRAMLLPCTCGCNERERLYGTDKMILKCIRCGRKVVGKNEMNVRVNWNKEITREMEREV